MGTHLRQSSSIRGYQPVVRVTLSGMRRIGLLILTAAVIAGCGGNSTGITAAVTHTPAAITPSVTESAAALSAVDKGALFFGCESVQLAKADLKHGDKAGALKSLKTAASSFANADAAEVHDLGASEQSIPATMTFCRAHHGFQ